MHQTQPRDAYDLTDILTEEARMLRARSFASARLVMVVIGLAGTMIAATGQWGDAILWTLLASGMVGVTLVYARLVWADGIPEHSVQRYLRGHVVVTALTGAVWGGYAIYFSEPDSEIRTFVAGLLLTSITAGGALSGTVYRPGYLALIICALLPFGIYLVALGEGVLYFFGYFTLLYFVMCYLTNEQLSQRTREDIVSRLGREAARKIVEQSEEIERLYAQKTRFMENISHDLTQPLLAQRQFIQTLKTQLSEPEHIALLQQIENTQNSQERLIQELAELSQVETRKAQPQVSEYNVAELFDQIVAEFAVQAQDQRMQLRWQSEVATMRADRHFVERILRNLLSNAVKYAGRGADITVSAHSSDKGVCVSVADSGAGIPVNDLEIVFDEYVRLDTSPEAKGSGLGLTISRRLAEQMGGTLSLQSSPDQGTVANLDLPDQAAPEVCLPRFVILIGEDVSTEFGPWANLFSAWMWEFAHAADVDQALRLVTSLRLEPDAFVFAPPPQDEGDVSRMTAIAPVAVLSANGVENISAAEVIEYPISAAKLRAALENLM